MELVKLSGFNLLRAEVERQLAEYELVDVTDDSSYKEAKKQRASLNKVSTAVDTERKKLAKELKTEVDKIIELVDSTIKVLDERTTSWEENLKAQRQTEIAEFYQTLNFPQEIPLERIFDSKWLNITSDWKTELAAIRSKITSDLAVVKAFDSSQVFLNTYYKFLDVTTAIDVFRPQPTDDNRYPCEIKFRATNEEYLQVVNYIKLLGLKIGE